MTKIEHPHLNSLRNYLSGIRAWHILHGVPWDVNDDENEIIIKAAKPLTPKSSRRDKRLPYTVEYMESLIQHLDPKLPLHAAVIACLTTCFYCTARVGEFTVKNLNAFDPNVHVKKSNMRVEKDRQGLEQTTFFLPRTKTSIDGEDVYWAKQNGSTDPQTTIFNHFEINKPEDEGPLFAYQTHSGPKPLTKTKFLQTLNLAATQAGLQPCKGHGIRIGATLEYLLRRVPFEVVKVKGRWASNAFVLYLRRHAQVLAPFMQAVPEVHEELLRITLPPPR